MKLCWSQLLNISMISQFSLSICKFRFLLFPVNSGCTGNVNFRNMHSFIILTLRVWRDLNDYVDISSATSVVRLYEYFWFSRLYGDHARLLYYITSNRLIMKITAFVTYCELCTRYCRSFIALYVAQAAVYMHLF